MNQVYYFYKEIFIKYSSLDLPKKILSGKVNSAIRVAFPEDDFRTTVLAANSNMFAMGESPLAENYG